jgi:hypothetical protein
MHLKKIGIFETKACVKNWCTVLCKYISSKCQIIIEICIKLHLQNGFLYIRVKNMKQYLNFFFSKKTGKVNLTIFCIQFYSYTRKVYWKFHKN